MKRLLPLLAVLLFPWPASAALPPDGNEKYKLEVVVKCGAHNWLGDRFRADLNGDLTGALQDALGPMADVQVVDLKKAPAADAPALWRDFDARGFAALDGSREMTGVKTHFLRIDFTDGFYELQARQFDGLTGFVTALRRDRTPDRTLVPRLAAQMIAQDFGATGAVTVQGDAVTVQFRGAARPGAALDRWVRRGDVFAVYSILRAADGKERGTRVPDTLVHVTDDPKDGKAAGQVWYRSANNPLKAQGVAHGFRVVRLGTGSGKMRLRLLDERGQPHTASLQIRVHAKEFVKGQSPEEEVLDPDRGGVYVTKHSYDNISFVRVITGGEQVARLPVEVLEDRVVTVQVGVSAKTETQGQLQFKRGELERMFTESVVVHVSNAAKEINALMANGKNDEALKRAETSRAALEDDIKRLTAELEEFRKEVVGLDISLKYCEGEAVRLNERKTTLNQKIGELAEAVRVANDPAVLAKQKKLTEAFAKAKALIENNDYTAAIAQLQSLIKEFGEQDAARKLLKDLEAAWLNPTADQQAARDFVYKDWAGVKTAIDVEAKLPTARLKLQVLAKLKDNLALLKLRATLPEVSKILRDEIQAVSKDPDDQEKVAKVKKLAEDFDKLAQEVEAAVK